MPLVVDETNLSHRRVIVNKLIFTIGTAMFVSNDTKMN